MNAFMETGAEGSELMDFINIELQKLEAWIDWHPGLTFAIIGGLIVLAIIERRKK